MNDVINYGRNVIQNITFDNDRIPDFVQDIFRKKLWIEPGLL